MQHYKYEIILIIAHQLFPIVSFLCLFAAAYIYVQNNTGC